MVKVVFRDRVNSPYPIAGIGTLNIPENESISRHVGCTVPFTLTAYYADAPLKLHSQGVVARSGTAEFYEFEIVELDGDGKVGHLRVLSEVEG